MAQDPGKDKGGPKEIRFANKWIKDGKGKVEKYAGRWKIGDECWITISQLILRNVKDKKEREKEFLHVNGFDILHHLTPEKDKKTSKKSYTFKIKIEKKGKWNALCFALHRMDKNCDYFNGYILKEDLFPLGMMSAKAHPIYSALRDTTYKLWNAAITEPQQLVLGWTEKKIIESQWGLWIEFWVSKNKPK